MTEKSLFDSLHRDFEQFLYNEKLDLQTKQILKERISSTIRCLQNYGFSKSDISFEMRFRYQMIFSLIE